jgi:class 3 adenylate cyclase
VGKIDALSVAVESGDRKDLLELYARTKKALEAQEQALSFLSIDVVGSTGMKENEDSAIASRDFARYMAMVDEVIERHDALKASWTPDGVMICFGETHHSINAGQEVLRSLERFNREVKAMRADFKVRIGINSGQVLYDERVPMEEMSSRVIDIAGHMQKYAEVNAIYINKDAIDMNVAGSRFFLLKQRSMIAMSWCGSWTESRQHGTDFLA